MRVSVNRDVCGGHGDCVVLAPEIFDFRDDDDVVTVVAPEPEGNLQAKARKACDTCPTGAITVAD